MKKIVAIGVVLLATAVCAAPGDFTEEVLVLNSAAVELPVRHPTRKGALVQNLGPNTIYCATGAQADGGSGAVLTKAIAVVSNGSMYVAGGPRLFCRAATADQVTGAATVVMEVP